MEIGTAIFLSAFLVFLILLYIFTRDRVRWGRILGYATLLLVISAVAIGGYFYWTNRPEYNRHAVFELDGIKLGDTESDVLFKKGDYVEVCNNVEDKDEKYYVFKNVNGYSSRATLVGLRLGIVQRIVRVGDIRSYDTKMVSSVSEYDNVDDVRRKWGTEDFVRTIDTKTRTYVYKKYNLAISLNSNKVEAVTVFNPEYYYLSPEKPEKKEECYDPDGKKR